jgi:glutathione S-transferase
VVPAQQLVLTVYRIPFSTNVERIALAAGHKGLTVEWIDVHPADRSPVTEVSGQPLVPVLVAGDEVVTDSPVIVDWLERHAPEPALYPREPALQATVRIFVEWFNHVWKRAPNLIAAEEEKPEPDQARIAELGARVRRSLDLFETLLDGRDYLFGVFGAADVMAFPFLKYGVFGTRPEDDERFHEILVEHLEIGGGYPRLRAWAERVDGHRRS